jgi:predicted DNA-binding transcriptional regulator YafY
MISCLLLLQGKRRVTARELAAQLDVSTRTVYRDVEALCEAGVPIHMERGPLGGIVLADEYRRGLALFTDDELQSLFATGPGPMADLGIASQGRALQKLAGALPGPQRRTAQTSRDRLFVDHNRWSRGAQPTDMLMRLRTASQRDRRVRLTYRDRHGEQTERLLDPLGLVAKAGVWYLIAREAEKGYRTFRVERIVAVDELRETFARPADFNLEAYWNESVLAIERQTQETYDVTVRVPKNAVAKFTAFWETTILHEDDASATVRIAFPSRHMAVAYVLVMADTVEILAPAALPEAIVACAHAALERWGAAVV